MKFSTGLPGMFRMKSSSDESCRKSSRLATSILGAACIFSVNAHAVSSQWATLTGLHVNNAPTRALLSGLAITGICSQTWPVILFDTSQGGTGNAKELYAAAMSALMAGKEVRVYAETCWANYPVVSALEIR